MTSRLGKPDTQADIDLRKRLGSDGLRHFVMIAGAGSGKTTSLVKALNFLKQSRGLQLKKETKQIACITYTTIAAEEISSDVGHDPLFHVSTIHSFLWSVIKPFQRDIHAWVRKRLTDKISESEMKIDKPRTREATREKERLKILRYQDQLEQLDSVKKFIYGTGSDYLNGILGHGDILKMGPSLIIEFSLMRKVVAQRFPVIFVDESQDTDANFVHALKALAEEASREFCLGFFGDPMQMIYMTGVGSIDIESEWEVIEKPENFRCPVKVLQVINNIRSESDGLMQTGGRVVEQNGESAAVQGTARLFILPADDRRTERLAGVRQWLSDHNNDPRWNSDEPEGDVRMLVVVHRIAATQLGFPNLYSSMNDKAPESLVSGLVDGTAWIVRPFLRYILPLIQANRLGDSYRVISLLRQFCPRLKPERLVQVNAALELESLKSDLVSLSEMFSAESSSKIGDVINFLVEKEFLELDERFESESLAFSFDLDITENTKENAALRFMCCPIEELWGYQTYIENLSPFATQQGVKGAEFERVLVVVDDEQSTSTSFSYDKYFGLKALSETDNENIARGKETVIDRTRRLFYVCCSRALNDLAVVVFSKDVQAVNTAIKAKGYFESTDIHCLEL